jgi:hypothetical protein
MANRRRNPARVTRPYLRSDAGDVMILVGAGDALSPHIWEVEGHIMTARLGFGDLDHDGSWDIAGSSG